MTTLSAIALENVGPVSPGIPNFPAPSPLDGSRDKNAPDVESSEYTDMNQNKSHKHNSGYNSKNGHVDTSDATSPDQYAVMSAYLEPTTLPQPSPPIIGLQRSPGLSPKRPHQDSGIGDAPESSSSEGMAEGGHPLVNEAGILRQKRPDSLALRSPGSEYEELPGGRYTYADADDLDQPVPPRVPMPSHPSVSLNSSCPVSMTQPLYRKRQNPLYDSREHELPTKASPSASAGCSQCVAVCLLVTCVVSLTALILAILIITGVILLPGSLDPKNAYLISPVNSSTLMAALQRIEELENKYDALNNKYVQLQGLVETLSSNQTHVEQDLLGVKESAFALENRTQNQTHEIARIQVEVERLQNKSNEADGSLSELYKVNSNHEEKISNLALNVSTNGENIIDLTNKTVEITAKIEQLQGGSPQDISILKYNLTVQSDSLALAWNKLSVIQTNISQYTQEFNAKLDSVEKMPGPQGPVGPRGVQGSPGVGNLSACEVQLLRGRGAFVPANSPKYPTVQDNANDWVVLGASCSTDGATTSTLVVKEDTPREYRCTCYDKIKDAPEVVCKLYVWKCPRIS